jgi:hypothetical protein
MSTLTDVQQKELSTLLAAAESLDMLAETLESSGNFADLVKVPGLRLGHDLIMSLGANRLTMYEGKTVGAEDTADTEDTKAEPIDGTENVFDINDAKVPDGTLVN